MTALALPGDPNALEQDFPEELESNDNILNDDAIISSLTSLIQRLEQGDSFARESWLPTWKKHLYFWRGFQHLIEWNRAAKDWSMPQISEGNLEDADNGVINYYRGYGESIIAALSASIPELQFYPDDADNYSDIMTAKAYSKIEEMIRGHNQADILLTKILFLLYNQGFVAIHNCQVYSEEFGVDIVPDYGWEDRTSQFTDQLGQPQTQTEQVPVKTGEVKQPKGRQLLKAYGPLNVKMAHYARRQQDSPYLILEVEKHVAEMRQLYPAFFDEIQESGSNTIDRSWRTDANLGEINPQLCTEKQCWLQNWALNLIGDPDIRERLKAEFPDGLCVVYINDVMVEIRSETFNKYWTVLESPLSLSIHADPIGRVMIPVQEMRSDLVDLTMETIRQAIPETFADPAVLDFESYGKVQKRPGQIFKVKARPGQNLSNSFYQFNSATLSKEVEFFFQRLDSDGQFVTGAYPSIYGGQLSGGSQTLGEYNTSKNQSLQRLSVHYKTMLTGWARSFEKAVRSYHENMAGDEKFTKKVGNTFQTVWISELELAGKVAEVRTNCSDQLPISWEQKRQLLFDLLNMKSPEINAALYHPENVGEIARTLGWTDLYIPGDSDRNKQLYEIQELLRGQPEQGPQGPIPSIPIDSDIDDDHIHIEVTRAFLLSAQGIEAQKKNPMGYMNVKAHLAEHMLHMQEINANVPSNDPSGNEQSGVPSGGSGDRGSSGSGSSGV